MIAARVAAVAVAGLALTALGVAPQISARLGGDEVRLRVEPVDPIDPFRGAYVDLGYPDLQHDVPEDDRGTVFVSLAEREGVWVGEAWSRDRPAQGRYLTCDDRAWQVRCGIESLFLPQDDAAAMGERLADGAIATVRIDRWGNAALMGVEDD